MRLEPDLKRRITGARLNFSAVVTIVLFLVGQTVTAVWWASKTDQRVEQAVALKHQVDSIQDKLEPIASRVTRIEVLQESTIRSMVRMEDALDDLQKHSSRGSNRRPK
jgi:cell division protein FtsX